MSVRFPMARFVPGVLATFLLLPAFAARKDKDTLPALPGEKILSQGHSVGSIDWDKDELLATGMGAIPNNEQNEAKAYLRARGYAKLDAMRNLLMVIDHVRIDSETTGEDFEAKSDVIKAEVSGVIRGAHVVSERKVAMGASTIIEVTIGTAMYGDHSVASVFLPEVRRSSEPGAYHVQDGTGQAPPTASAIVVPEAPTGPAIKLMSPDVLRAFEADTHYGVTRPGEPVTSVIVDARGGGVWRSMAPKIRRSDGSEVWGSVDVDPDYVIEHGIAIYTHSVAEARRTDRAGTNPIVIRAMGTTGGRFNDDPVIGNEDADQLLGLNKQYGFMNKLNVIIVIDPKQ